MSLYDYSVLLDLRKELFPHFVEHQRATAEEIAKKIKSYVDADNLRWVVDLGCGTGEILQKLSELLGSMCPKKQIAYIGVDSCQEEILRAIRGKHSCTFVCADAVEHLTTLKDVDWNKALLLCIGHTLPHFDDQDGFLDALKKLRPAFLITDFYHDWDTVVAFLKDNHGDEKHEPRGEVKKNQDVYVLTTRCCDGESDRILRGIQIFRDNQFIPKFWTKQVFQPQIWFTNRLSLIDYIPKSELHYHSGYGQMRGVLFARQCLSAKTTNAVYAEVVSRRVKDISALPHITTAMELFGARMAAAILPFDQNHTFAKYVSIVPSADALADRCRLMYVDEPSNIQDKLPTAFGLYMTLLNEVGASTVIRFAKLPNANKCPIDIQFGEDEETPFFVASGWEKPKNIQQNTESNSRARESFFVIPFYFADIPLFCLVVDFYGRLPIQTTDSSVYVSLLRNISQLIKQELLATFERDVLRPFIEKAVFKLCSSHGLKPSDAILHLQRMREQASGKPWKSWLLTLPSEEIRDLEIVKSERGTLTALWQSAETWVLSDTFRRISDWFQIESFFSGAEDPLAHKQHVPSIHNPKIARLLIRCGDILKANYFGEGKIRLRELTWLAEKIAALHSKSEADETSHEAFRALKFIFCRTGANEGDLFRFHLKRIACLCKMYQPGASLECPSNEQYQHKWIPIKNDKTNQLIDLVKNFRDDSVEGFTLTEERIDNANDAVCIFKLNLKLKSPFHPGGSEGEDNKNIMRAFANMQFEKSEVQRFRQLTICFSISGPTDENSNFDTATWDTCQTDKYFDLKFETQ